MQWKYFLGASFLTAALLVPHAGTEPVIAGMALALLLQWLRSRIRGGRKGGH
jgi:mannose/fructose-specific phosphotransferase system component IIA